MTELSFLLELLLEHKIPKDTRVAVAARIKQVESSMHSVQNATSSPAAARGQTLTHRPIPAPPEYQELAASLAFADNADVVPSSPHFGLPDRRPRQPEPIPAGAAGLTSAAQDAMATRNKLIAEAQAGIAKKGPAVGRGHGTK